MTNGFLVVDEMDWEGATEQQRDWMIFKTLRSMDERLRRLEKWNKVSSFAGGCVGGFAAVMIYGMFRLIG
jgi:hypothetical protein